MMIDDVEKPGQQDLEGFAVVSCADVAIGGMEKPEAGIGGVIEAGGLSFGKHVRDQTITYVLGKAAEDVFGFAECAP